MLRRVANAFLSSTKDPTGPPTVRSAPTAGPSASGGSPGQYGATATIEVDPRRVGAVSLSYNPVVDGDPDPGEIVWTWVPFEERDGRGKDRPVLVVARADDAWVLVVQLTSKDHSHEGDFVPLGTGTWDSAGRPSWANLDRVFRVHPAGMRREAAQLPTERFSPVAAALRARYGWR
ncbi:type II toxin-antitoxin system PemK/MazF family toxin [Plantibacter flavus]